MRLMVVKRFSMIASVALAIVLATSTFALAEGRRGGFVGHSGGGHFQAHPGFRGQFHGRPGFPGHRAFDGRRFDGRRFDHRFDGRRFDHRFDGRFHHRFHRFAGPVIVAPFFWPSYPYPVYQPPAPTYWYYCPSYGAYYPSVQSCPEPWVTVPG